jgi:hypothetical protein
MVWKPAKALGLGVGLIMVLTMLGIDALLIESMLNQPFSINLFFTVLLFVLSLPLVVLWLYWYYCLVTLRYHLDRNALTIICGASHHRIPMDTICEIAPGSAYQISRGFRGVGWPGFLKGHLRLRELGRALVFSTEPVARQLIVVTDGQAYGISPRDAQGFLDDWAARRALGVIRPAIQGKERISFAAFGVWKDRWFWGMLALAFVANMALWGWLSGQFMHLPERIPLHFDSAGQVDLVGPKAGLLLIPGIGALVLLANGALGFLLHHRERLASHLLIAIALTVQAVVWYAVLGVLRR